MLHLILCGLQDYGEITLPIDSAHTLFLRMVETRPPPKPVRDHDVRWAAFFVLCLPWECRRGDAQHTHRVCLCLCLCLSVKRVYVGPCFHSARPCLHHQTVGLDAATPCASH